MPFYVISSPDILIDLIVKVKWLDKPLINPTPTGIIGMSIIVVLSVFIFFRKLTIQQNEVTGAR